MLWIKSSFIVLLLLVASFANAEQALTSKQIQQWLSSVDAIIQWSEKQEALKEDEDDDTETEFSVESMIKELKTAGLYDEAEKIIQDNGYDSPEQWVNIHIKIIRAAFALQMESKKDQINAQKMMAQLEEFKNNPSIPAEQKEVMINMMQSSFDNMQEMSKAPEADKEAIKPFLAQVKEKLEDEDEDANWEDE